MQIDVADQTEPVTIVPLHRFDVHGARLKWMQGVKAQGQQIVEQQHQVAVGMKYPGQTGRLDGVSHAPHVRHQHSIQYPWRKHGAGFVGHVVEAPDIVHAQIMEVADDGDAPVCVAPEYGVDQSGIVSERVGEAVQAQAHQHGRDAQTHLGGNRVVALIALN